MYSGIYDSFLKQFRSRRFCVCVCVRGSVCVCMCLLTLLSFFAHVIISVILLFGMSLLMFSHVILILVFGFAQDTSSTVAFILSL